MKKLILIFLILSTVFLTCSLEDTVTEAPPIHLESGELDPEQAVQSDKVLSEQDIEDSPRRLIQLDHIPTEAEKQILTDNGVTLLTYIPDNSWIAHLEPGAEDYLNDNGLTFTTELSSADKLSSNLQEEGPGSWTENEDGSFKVAVVVFEDASDAEIRSQLSNYGDIAEEPEAGNIWLVDVEENQIENLAEQDIVEWVENSPPPLLVNNIDSRDLIDVDTLFQAPYNLNGSGVVLAEWDAGHANHTDFNGRLTIGDINDGSPNNHSIHVAGTMVGNGSLSATFGASAEAQRGMAPNASLISYEWPNTVSELYIETNESITDYSAVLSQNSWGYNVHSNCSLMGEYDTFSQAYDHIINGNQSHVSAPITIVFSAGNERSTSYDGARYYCGHASQGGHTYNTTSGPGGTAKNVITVGALDKNKNMASFSSWGPTDDGRLKPEVVAIGSSINSTCEGNGHTSNYCVKSGTSMAAPAVSGLIALVHEKWSATQSSTITPATVKAILTHTATDVNESGPDYTSGYGLVNATLAIDLVANNTSGVDLIVQDNISQNGQDTFTFYLNTTNEDLKFTLVWDDYPGAPEAAKELVNDLDLLVYAPNQTLYYPWTLDPANPANPAVRNQKDSLNPIEQINISDPAEGIWTVTVNGTSIPYGPEAYSLVSNHDLVTLLANLESPANDTLSTTGNVTFNCSASTSSNITAITLYNNISGTWQANETTNFAPGGEVNWTNWTLTGLPEGSYLWSCLANDSSGQSIFANDIRTLLVNTPPASAGNLTNVSAGYSWIYWNWTNPTDNDFNHTEIWINDSFETNTSNQFYNFTSANTNTTYEIGLRTVDTAGGINTTWVNNTTRTFADSVSPTSTLNSPADLYASSSFTVIFNCSATDNHNLSNITLFSNFSGTWGPNTTNNVSGIIDSTLFNVTIIPDGVYAWNCMANDSSFNNDSANSDRTLIIDLENPNLTDNTSGLLINRTESINFTANVSDSHGINYVELNISGNNYTLSQHSADIYFYNWNSTNASTKLYNYSITAYDNSGRTNGTTGSFEVAEKIYSNTTNLTANTSTVTINATEIKLNITVNSTVANSNTSARVYTSDPNQTAGPSNKLNVSRFYEMNVDSTTNNSLSYYIATFYYDQDNVPATLNESTLQVYKLSGSSWSLVSDSDNTIVDTSVNSVQVNLSSFSEYAIFGSENVAAGGAGEGNDENGGGGGGGGGAGATGSNSGSPRITESAKFGDIGAGKSLTKPFSKSADLHISQIKLVMKEDANNIIIQVTKENEKPRSLPDPAGETFQFLKIDSFNFKTTALDKAEIRFFVDNSWLDSIGLEKSNVKLLRYTNSQWTELETSIFREDSAQTHYKAVTPGFSYFAISASAPEQTQETPAEEVEPETTGLKSTPEIAKSSFLVQTIVFFLIIGTAAVFILAFMRKIKHHKRKSTPFKAIEAFISAFHYKLGYLWG